MEIFPYVSKLAATEVSIRFLKKETCGSLIDSISSPTKCCGAFVILQKVTRHGDLYLILALSSPRKCFIFGSF